MRAIKEAFSKIYEDKNAVKVMIAALGSALVAGTLPELLKLIPGQNVTLVVIFVVGLIVLAASWISMNGRSGVGIAVFLPPSPEAKWSETKLLEQSAVAKRQHLSFFYVNVDELQPGLVGIDRVNLAQRVIESRLKEEHHVKPSAVHFYLACGLSSSFRLGQQTFNRDQGGQLRIFEFDKVIVQQVPTSRAQASLPPLSLKVTSDGAATTPESYNLGSLIRQQPVNLGSDGSIRVNRHALVLKIADTRNMVEEAIAAARGASPEQTGYLVGPNDVCSTALVLECTATTFPNDSAAYNELLRKIVQDWNLYLATQASSYNSIPEGRLFISAPTSLAFALGALLPFSTKVIDRIR